MAPITDARDTASTKPKSSKAARLSWVGIAVAVAIFSALVSAVPAQASPASAESTPAARPLIDERRCNSTELPRQIWLTSASRPTRCFGGLVGGFNLNNFPVQWISTGDYWAAIWCNSQRFSYRPATDVLLNRVCQRLEILPAG